MTRSGGFHIPYMVWLIKIEIYPPPPLAPKFENLHYGLWQLRRAITLASFMQDVCTKLRGFGVGQSNGIIQISVRPTLVVMETS